MFMVEAELVDPAQICLPNLTVASPDWGIISETV